jgi:catechol 2,3-dioxygenase-like lactoylglutathione lyase family enzyme
MRISHLDHLVLTVKDIKTTIEFYTNILGMNVQYFGDNRVALIFGNQKINLHQAGLEFSPKAQSPIPGSADLCFLIDCEIDKAVQHVTAHGVKILEGPVKRTGATGELLSIYCRDPDDNLIELSQLL